MTAGGREFQVAGAAQLKDRFPISVHLNSTSRNGTADDRSDRVPLRALCTIITTPPPPCAQILWSVHCPDTKTLPGAWFENGLVLDYPKIVSKSKVDNLYRGSKRSRSLQNRYYNTPLVHWTHECWAYQTLHAAQHGWGHSQYKLFDNCDCRQSFCMSSWCHFNYLLL